MSSISYRVFLFGLVLSGVIWPMKVGAVVGALEKDPLLTRMCNIRPSQKVWKVRTYVMSTVLTTQAIYPA